MLPDHVAKNREAWTGYSQDYREPGRRLWQTHEISWGIWNIPESEVRALEGIDFSGLDTVELGCGTGYVSAWLAKRGARPVGIDNSAQQLATARRLQEQHGLHFPLIHGNAESVPLPDASFDLAISE